MTNDQAVVLLVAIVSIAAVLTWYYWSAGTTDFTAGRTRREEEATPVRNLPTLPTGGLIVLGFLISVLIGLALWSVGFHSIAALSPFAVSSGPMTIVLWLLTFVLGATATAIIFMSGLESPIIPTGFKGVPTLLDSRFAFFGLKLLYPEGATWSIPRIFGFKPVDMRGRPLIDKENPNDEEIVIEGTARVLPPPTDGQESPGRQRLEKFFLAQIKAKVAVRIQTFDPFLYLSQEDAEGILHGFIEEQVRLFLLEPETNDDGTPKTDAAGNPVYKDLFALPLMKESLRDHLEHKLDEKARGMGIDFIRIAVVDIALPKEVMDEAAKIPIELIQRAHQLYQGETIAKIAEELKKKFPGLPEKELKNLVLQAADLAKTTVTSFEGQAVPVVTPQQTH